MGPATIATFTSYDALGEPTHRGHRGTCRSRIARIAPAKPVVSQLLCRQPQPAVANERGGRGFSTWGDIVKILGALLVGAIIIAVAAFFVVRSLEDKVSEQLVSQVSRLAIPVGWEPLNDTVRREQFLCMSTNPCPSISRRWQADAAVTVQDLEQIAAAAGLTLAVEGPCERPANVLGSASLCIGRGVKDGYDYQLTVSSDAPEEPQHVSLDVRPS